MPDRALGDPRVSAHEQVGMTVNKRNLFCFKMKSPSPSKGLTSLIARLTPSSQHGAMSFLPI